MTQHGQNYPAAGASQRLAALFEQRLGEPISRAEVQEVANQLDYMKRLRRNGGARDILDAKGIALLWGKGDAGVIAQLGLGPVTAHQFVAYRPKSAGELALLRANGHSDLQDP
jgi:hypothetical protein